MGLRYQQRCFEHLKSQGKGVRVYLILCMNSFCDEHFVALGDLPNSHVSLSRERIEYALGRWH